MVSLYFLLVKFKPVQKTESVYPEGYAYTTPTVQFHSHSTNAYQLPNADKQGTKRLDTRTNMT